MIAPIVALLAVIATFANLYVAIVGPYSTRTRLYGLVWCAISVAILVALLARG